MTKGEVGQPNADKGRSGSTESRQREKWVNQMLTKGGVGHRMLSKDEVGRPNTDRGNHMNYFCGFSSRKLVRGVHTARQ